MTLWTRRFPFTYRTINLAANIVLNNNPYQRKIERLKSLNAPLTTTRPNAEVCDQFTYDRHTFHIKPIKVTTCQQACWASTLSTEDLFVIRDQTSQWAISRYTPSWGTKHVRYESGRVAQYCRVNVIFCTFQHQLSINLSNGITLITGVV